MTKDERQQIATDKWWNASKYGSHADMWGTLNHITGFGKTYETCQYIIKPFLALYEAVYKIQHQVDCVVMIMTPLADLVKQWEKTMEKLGVKGDVQVTTVHSLVVNDRKPKVGLLIVDELHYFYGGSDAEVFYRYANGELLKRNYMVGLTATPYFRDGRHKLLLEQVPVIDTVTEKEAKDNGWIPRTNEYNLAVKMSIEEHNAYYENEALLTKFGAMLGDNPFLAANRVLQGGYSGGQFYKGFQFATFWAKKNGWEPGCAPEINAIWNPNLVIGYGKAYMKCINKRMMLLGSVQAKLDAAVELIKRLNVPTITFSKSTEVADLLTVACNKEGIAAASYHSNIESKAMIDPTTGDLFRVKSGPNKGQPKIFGAKTLKERTLEDMKSGKLQVLNTVDAASTGLDIPRIRLAIILARGTSDNKQKQRAGRVKRFDPNDLDASMLVVNLYVPLTKDEQYVQQSQRANKGQIVHSIDDVLLNIPSDELVI